jgi:hypothetical protein
MSRLELAARLAFNAGYSWNLSVVSIITVLPAASVGD